MNSKITRNLSEMEELKSYIFNDPERLFRLAYARVEEKVMRSERKATIKENKHLFEKLYKITKSHR